MSKKGKLILATAVFGTALFAASCGGGGGGGTTAGTGTGGGGGGGGGGTPSPTEQGRVLALLNMGSASAGAVNKVAICRLMSNNKAECGSDLNPNADVTLEYVHEFSNGNVVLKDSDNKLYFFDGSQVKKLTTYRTLGGISDINDPAGIAIPSSATYYVTPNFVVMHGSGGKLVAVSKDGKVIKEDSSVTINGTKLSCHEVVTKGGTDYKLKVDGTSYSTTITIPDDILTSAGGKYLVKVQEGPKYKIYLSDSKCSASGVLVDTLSNDINDAKMVKVGDDFYIAVRAGTGGTNLYYYRVSGNTSTPLNTSITLHSADKYYYALDGRGVLYAITAADTVSAYKPTNGASITPAATVSGVAGLLAFADRVLAKVTTSSGDNKAYEITATDSGVNAVDKGGGSLYTALNRCTDANTQRVDGEGTNFIRCLYDGGATEVLYSLAYNSGNYQSASYDLPGASSSSIAKALFGVGKVLVRPGGSSTIYLCNTTTTPSISCSVTDLPDITISINNYLKVNGNDVFYRIGSSGLYTLKVGNIFDPPSALPFTASSASGGNASFDLNRFAFSSGPDFCRNQIIYFPSRNASARRYDLPSGTCVARILKVY